MKKSVWMKLALIGIFIIIIFFSFFAYKKIKTGNNESNKSAEQIKEYILNVKSYTAELDVTVNSNKNSNKYLLKQECNSNGELKQVVEKPENIEGTEMVYKDGNLTISNSNLNLRKIYSNYPYLSNNILWLNAFVEDYKNSNGSAKTYEENNQMIIELSPKINKYATIKKLYLDNKTGKPLKMEIKDNNQNTTVYILYKEIDINNN